VATEPEVFVIESLDPDDEGNGRFEGAIISRILGLHGKTCKYRYVRTRKEFKAAVRQFGKSRYRYLHISCHADPTSMCTTNQDEIGVDELAEILNPHLAGRRLFLSACELVHMDLARAIIPKSRCFSVVGPNEKVRFTDATILWSSLYHLMFSRNSEAMKRADLIAFLRQTLRLFEVNMSFFSRSASGRHGVSRDLLGKD
jgi:hypothetical protein